MNRHVSTEDLSAYLDSELGLAEVVSLEAHCAACAECSARLASLRRVVNGLGQVGRAEPPAALRQQVRRQVQAAPPAGWHGALGSIRLFLFPLRPALRTSAAFGLAMVAGLFAVIHGVGDRFLRVPDLQSRPHEEVEIDLGGTPFTVPETTSKVAGRDFIWTDDGWVQKGLEGKTPETRLDAHSPQGRALLTRYSDLDLLLADGSSVVLRYNLETVEIRRMPPVTHIPSFPPQTRTARRHGHGMMSA